jgi:hypothetical protein
MQAFLLHTKQNEILKRKKEILDEVSYFHNYSPSNVLYIGFNPLILIDNTKTIYVTEVSNNVKNYLNKAGVKFNFIEYKDLTMYAKKFDVVIALDEFFTFAKDEIEQKNKVIEICRLATDYIITTCRDYKNQEFKDKEFSLPALIKNGNDNNIFLEFHNYDAQDRNSWQTSLYKINGNNFENFGPYAKKIMFFKQLAKFSHDAGAASFHVHKNLMYKSLIKKNYEHVISIRFNNGN